MLKKIDKFMWEMAEGDDGLTRELTQKGSMGILKEALALNVACLLTLILLVIL